MTHHCDTRFGHIPALLFLCSIVYCLKRLIQHHCFHAHHTQGSACCVPHAYTTLHDTIFHPFHTARSCFAFPVGCLLSHSLAIFEKPPCYVPLHLASARTVLFSNLIFLSFFSFGEIFGEFWFFAFWFVLLILRILDFLHFETQRWTWVAQYTHRPTSRGRHTRTHTGTTGGGWRKTTRARVPRGVGGDTSLCSHINKRPPTDHRTTLHSPLPPNHTLPLIPAPTSRTLHLTITHSLWKNNSMCPTYSSQCCVKLP